MARNKEKNRIRSYSVCHSPCGLWPPYLAGELGIRDGGSPRQCAQCRPDLLLKGRTFKMERDFETFGFLIEVSRELFFDQCRYGVVVLLLRRESCHVVRNFSFTAKSQQMEVRFAAESFHGSKWSLNLKTRKFCVFWI
jgi:hypothetical protein